MKKFICKVCGFLLLCLLVTVGFPVVVDPYNVFHANAIRDNGIEPNRHYIKMNNVLTHPDKFNAFIFGSSRVGALHVERIPSLRCYNMAYSSGLPGEFLVDLQVMIRNGIVPEKVYVCVDEQSYMDHPENRDTDPIRASYEFATNHPFSFYRLYFDSAKTLRSLLTIIKHQETEGFSERFYDLGWIQDYDWSMMKPDAYVRLDVDPADYTAEDVNAVVEDVHQIVLLCEENGIELVVFTNPDLWMWYDIGVESGYLDMLRGIVQYTDFYNFGGRNNITIDKTNYSDPAHYSAYVGDMMIDCMEGGTVDEELYSQGFGWYVTKDNIEELIEAAGKLDPEAD